MGTNFYWHQTACPTCKRFDVLHVGKRSGGWSFGFRGYRHETEDAQSPTGFPVESRADWRKVFTEIPGRLVDEYGREEPDPLAWLDALEAPTLEQQRSEWSRERMGPFWQPDDPREWRDAEGFRFSNCEFS